MKDCVFFYHKGNVVFDPWNDVDGNAVDDPFSFYGKDKIPHPLRVVRVGQRQRRKADHRVHRRADVVGHVGQERALGPVRPLGNVVGFLRQMPCFLQLRAVLLLLAVQLLLLLHPHENHQYDDENHRQRDPCKDQRLYNGVHQRLRVGRDVLRGDRKQQHPHAGLVAVAVRVVHALQYAVDVPAHEHRIVLRLVRGVQLGAAAVHHIDNALPPERVRVVAVDDDGKVLQVSAEADRGVAQRDGLLQLVEEQYVRPVRAEYVRNAADALVAVHQLLNVADHALLA